MVVAVEGHEVLDGVEGRARALRVGFAGDAGFGEVGAAGGGGDGFRGVGPEGGAECVDGEVVAPDLAVGGGGEELFFEAGFVLYAEGVDDAAGLVAGFEAGVGCGGVVGGRLGCGDSQAGLVGGFAGFGKRGEPFEAAEPFSAVAHAAEAAGGVGACRGISLGGKAARRVTYSSRRLERSPRLRRGVGSRVIACMGIYGESSA